MQKVLIVEDEVMIADYLEAILQDAGYQVCGIAGCVADAIALGEKFHPDLGVIDLRLSHQEYGTDVARHLRRLGRFGVLYTTGNPDHAMLTKAEGEGCISKPYTETTVLAALKVVSDISTGSAHPSPAPRGFRLLGG